MTRLSDFALRVGLAALIGLGVAVAADAQPATVPPAERGLDARLDRLADGLDLSADQGAALDGVATRYAAADRAGLWAAAAEVATVLTDAQIDQLQAAAAARRGERGQARGERGAQGMRGARGQRAGRGRQGRAERPAGEERPALDEAQREALRAIRSDMRTRAEGLADQLREGLLTDAEFRAQVRVLREEGARRSAEVLPAEAAAKLAERQAQRDAAEAARVQALGLTADQQARLEARRTDRVRASAGRPDVRPYLDTDGRLDRTALRAAMRAEREQARAARGEREEILTDDQQDVAFLYTALAGGGGRASGRGHRGGRGGR